MAILVKRTAKNPIPTFSGIRDIDTSGMEARPGTAGPTGSISDAGGYRAPVTSVISPDVVNTPTTGTGMPVGVTPVSRPNIPTVTNKPTLPTTTKPTLPTPPTKIPTTVTPKVTTPTVTKPSTITSVVKPTTTVTPKVTNTTPAGKITTPTSTTKVTPTVTNTSKTGTSSILNSLLPTVGGAVAGSLLNKNTGKTITDFLGLTGGKTNNSNASNSGSSSGSKTSGTTGGGLTTGTKSTDTKLTDAQVQAELDKAGKTSYGPPSDAVSNGDGTYYSIDSNGFKTTYDKDGAVLGMEMGTSDELSAWAKLNNTTIDTTQMGDNGVMTGQVYTPDGTLTPKGSVTPTNIADNSNSSNMTDLGEGYKQDAAGNVYDSSGALVATMNGDGSYALVGSQDNSGNVDLGGGYYQDPKGDIYSSDGTLYASLGNDGNYALVGDQSQQGSDNTQTADNGGYTQDAAGNWYAPGGKLYARVSPDGSYTLAGDTTSNDNTSVDNTNLDNTVIADNTNSSDNSGDGGDITVKQGGLITMMKKGGGVRGYADGGTIIDSVDNGDGTYTAYYSDGTDAVIDNPSPTAYNPDGTTTDMTATVYNPDGTSNLLTPQEQELMNAGYEMNGDGTWTYTDPTSGTKVNVDSSGQYISTTPGTGITNTGNTRSPLVTPKVTNSGGSGNQDTGLGSITDLLKNGGVQGALLGTLIGQLMGSNSSPVATNQGVDMSQVGVINPRTTDFGIGAPNVVTADQYTNPVDTNNDIYSGTDLYHNLNAPGYNPVNPSDETAPTDTTAPVSKAGGGLATTHYTYGKAIDPAQIMNGNPNGMKRGGLAHPESGVSVVQGRHDYRQGAAVKGPGTGQSDDIPAMLADGEYVIDAELVSMLGDGSNKAGAEKLDQFREAVRKHKRATPLHKIPPPAKSPLAYMKGIK